jgi:hypothetical protein
MVVFVACVAHFRSKSGVMSTTTWMGASHGTWMGVPRGNLKTGELWTPLSVVVLLTDGFPTMVGGFLPDMWSEGKTMPDAKTARMINGAIAKLVEQPMIPRRCGHITVFPQGSDLSDCLSDLFV